MNIILPNKINGGKPDVINDARRVTVIGANGAGKTRFSARLIEMFSHRAYKLSALRAIFPTTSVNRLEGSIDMLYNEKSSMTHIFKGAAESEFERLIFLLMQEEFIDMLTYKAALKINGKAEMPRTRLDDVLRRWMEVFPQNRVQRLDGKLLFSNESDDEPYSSQLLSNGEKAVLYYIGAVLYAMRGAVIFVDSPEIFLHHSIMQTLWNVIEEMRPDCTFIYNTHDIEFASSRIDNVCVWVRSYDNMREAWDYRIVSNSTFPDEIYFDILGSRKPVLFVEGDEMHSIDSKFYPLIFTEYTVKPVGSCDKVIEVTRAFNDMQSFHHLDSHGIVDRDRRNDHEVSYLRGKKIFVPDVAEIENILMLEGVVRTVARHYHKDENRVFTKVKNAVLNMFRSMLKQQALMHVRHNVKSSVEMQIDRKFQNINALEDHISDLVYEINPRGLYDKFCRQFHDYEQRDDYAAVLKVFNEKTIINNSNVAQLCGLRNKDHYVKAILSILKEDGPDAQSIRQAVKECFGITATEEASAAATTTSTPPTDTAQAKQAAT